MKLRDDVTLMSFILAMFLLMGSSLEADEADQVAKDELLNGDMELANTQGAPDGWRFVATPKIDMQTATLVSEQPFSGESAALLDCSNGNNEFTNLMQSFNADGYRGQRIRFRAAVRTAELSPTARVQLWFRVDSGGNMRAFDNMQDRPIRSDEWKHFDTVLDVANDATKINVGMFVIGNGKAWIDDATLEVVGEEVKTTSATSADVFAAASHAPSQPFFTHWLWLPAIGCLLFLISQTAPSSKFDDGEDEASHPPLGWLRKFALHFSVLYWVLYCVFAQGNLGDTFVKWTAAHLMGIERLLVEPNGSGDTTYSYVKVLIAFVLSILFALVWSALDRRTTDCRISRDLIRSFLRYVLAATMVGYGLAKAGMVTNQFPIPGSAQLARTFGDSSPMGLLWTFMGASRTYTIFAGIGEVVGGLLLLFRRTTTLGAIVVVGVMLNIVMLNFCYDVPVKQFSAHLLAMAVFLLLPEAGRLGRLFVLNRPVDRVDLRPPYLNSNSGAAFHWVHGSFKLTLIVLLAGIPIFSHVRREVEHARTAEATAVADKLLMKRGFRWINEVPFNR